MSILNPINMGNTIDLSGYLKARENRLTTNANDIANTLKSFEDARDVINRRNLFNPIKGELEADNAYENALKEIEEDERYFQENPNQPTELIPVDGQESSGTWAKRQERLAKNRELVKNGKDKHDQFIKQYGWIKDPSFNAVNEEFIRTGKSEGLSTLKNNWATNQLRAEEQKRDAQYRQRQLDLEEQRLTDERNAKQNEANTKHQDFENDVKQAIENANAIVLAQASQSGDFTDARGAYANARAKLAGYLNRLPEGDLKNRVKTQLDALDGAFKISDSQAALNAINEQRQKIINHHGKRPKPKVKEPVWDSDKYIAEAGKKGHKASDRAYEADQKRLREETDLWNQQLEILENGLESLVQKYQKPEDGGNQ